MALAGGPTRLSHAGDLPLAQETHAPVAHALVDGRVALRGSARELFSSPKSLLKLGLTVPLATQAMMQLRERGYAVRTSVLNEEEALSEIEALLDVQRI